MTAAAMNAAIATLDASLIDDSFKGFPPAAQPVKLGEIGKQGWNLLKGDLPFPAAVLKTSALEHNSRWMDRFRKEQGVELCPHGKTTMSPHLFQRQLADGAWGITVATTQQLRIARSYGVSRVIMANQLVDPQGIRYVLAEMKRDSNFEFYCLVDSPASVQRLAEIAKTANVGRPLRLLLEGGVVGGRTGCRTLDQAAAVAKAVMAAQPHVILRGVEGFEGIMDGTSEERANKVRAFVDFLGAIAKRGIAENWFGAGEVIATAGGSAEFDIVADAWRNGDFGAPVKVVLRSGCYLTHDSGLYEDRFHDIQKRGIASSALANNGPKAALEVWALVQSIPEPGLAFVTMGKRDVSFDVSLPVPIAWSPAGSLTAEAMPKGNSIIKLNDQHGYLKGPADAPWKVGDRVAFGVSHPCTTFDRWQLIYLVDDAYNVTGAIRTFF
jgi:D-serine dehydratase